MGKFNKELLIRLLAEALATMIVQFVGCAAPTLLVNKSLKKDDPDFGSAFSSTPTVGGMELPAEIGGIFRRAAQPDALTYSMAWGGSVLAATQAFRILSGAHINPCVTLAAMIVKNVKIIDGLFYILMQLVGSGIGFGISLALFQPTGNMEKYFCLTAVTVVPWWKSILIEFLLTGAWVFAMCASWHEANQTMLESISLRIGVIVVACTMAGSVFTGSSMNPFRTLWSIMLSMYFKHCYVYIAMPIAAGFAIGFAWRFLYNMGSKSTGAEEG